MERIRERKAIELIEEMDNMTENKAKYFIGKLTEHFAVIINRGRIYVLNGSDNTVNIYIDQDWSTGELKKAEMNWASIGAVETSEAELFSKLIREAVEIVNEINDSEDLRKVINSYINYTKEEKKNEQKL